MSILRPLGVALNPQGALVRIVWAAIVSALLSPHIPLDSPRLARIPFVMEDFLTPAGNYGIFGSNRGISGMKGGMSLRMNGGTKWMEKKWRNTKEEIFDIKNGGI